MVHDTGAGDGDRRPDGDLAQAVGEVVNAPDFARAHLHNFYEEGDLALLAALATGERPVADLLAELPGLTLADLRRAHRRTVITLSEDETKAAAASLSDRFESWIIFEGWKDVPKDVRERLSGWDMDNYIEEIRPLVEEMKAGRTPAESTGNDTFVLLHEAEAIVAGARRVFVRPCSCRRVGQSCDKPVDVCIWIDEDERDQGWEISRERAVEILREADRVGLMFTANDADAAVATWICCCCSDCCYPIQAGRRLGATDVYPSRRYLATLDEGACTLCGICVRRCPFDAWTLEGKGRERVLRFTAEECRGCGVCATGCPEAAISMVKRGVR
jgi:Pyruvate/2-oxoacid:ferredoxin oxidoreductase delta subunit